MRLDASLDPQALAPVFARFGRIHLPRVLGRKDADGLSAAMAVTSWIRSMHVAGKSYDFELETLDAMSPEQRATLDQGFVEGGRTGFQYRYDAWRLSDEVEAGRRPRGAMAPLAGLYEMLNGPGFLNFVRTLTGDPRPAYVDAQATRYRAGDFLTAHDGAVEGKNRLYAYVLNLTPNWRTDWGGLLAFHDSDGHLAEAYVPTFNALNIFAVPQLHSVTQVASFAAGQRLSVTGWIRER